MYLFFNTDDDNSPDSTVTNHSLSGRDTPVLQIFHNDSDNDDIGGDDSNNILEQLNTSTTATVMSDKNKLNTANQAQTQAQQHSVKDDTELDIKHNTVLTQPQIHKSYSLDNISACKPIVDQPIINRSASTNNIHKLEKNTKNYFNNENSGNRATILKELKYGFSNTWTKF